MGQTAALAFKTKSMIKLFRHIRYDLMEKNKTGKYLLYAIGEIALVVIGILVALQINNWNEESKSNELLGKYETNIIAELKTDLLRLAELDSIHKTWEISLRNYIAYYNTEKPDMNILKSKRDSSKTGLTTLFNTSAYSIQDLISTGNLKLFPTHKKNAILKYKNILERNLFIEQKSGETVIALWEEFEKENDLLFTYNYSKKAHSAIKNWQYDLNSPQLKLWNNVVAKFLNLYEYQIQLNEQVRKEAKELIKVLEKNS